MKKNWKIAELTEFVSAIDLLGGISATASQAATLGFKIEDINYDFIHDSDIDPLSIEYRLRVIKIYQSISGRLLDQKSNEMMSIPDTRQRANPYGVNDISRISKHCRTIFNMMLLANLKPESKVLDMGAGWGLTTEMMAFTGAKVTALDINPNFIDLIKFRSRARNLDVNTINSSFDDFDVDDDYDVIFFYECLHHCSDLKSLLEKCQSKLKTNGKIIFAGEPITSTWWGPKHWGMRLDAESVYVMRKFGWFETGWSEDYIKSIFYVSGLNLKLIQGIGLDHAYIGYAMRDNEFKDSTLKEAINITVPSHWPIVS